VERIETTLKAGQAVQFRVLRKTGRNGEWQPMFLAGMLPSSEQ
jgi:hypothetical protein